MKCIDLTRSFDKSTLLLTPLMRYRTFSSPQKVPCAPSHSHPHCNQYFVHPSIVLTCRTLYKLNHAVCAITSLLLWLSMSPKFTYVVPCGSSVSFLLLSIIILYGYTIICSSVLLFMGIWILPTFWPLQIKVAYDYL